MLYIQLPNFKHKLFLPVLLQIYRLFWEKTYFNVSHVSNLENI